MFQLDFTNIPSSNYLGRVKQVPNEWTHPGYVTPFNILVIMLDGECRFTFPEQNRVLYAKKNHAVIIPQGVYYMGSCEQECEYYFFHFYNQLTEMTENEVKKRLREAEIQFAANTPKHHLRRAHTIFDQLYFSENTDISYNIHHIAVLLAECEMEIRKQDINRMLRKDLIFCQILTLISEISMEEFVNTPEYPGTLTRILGYINENYTAPITLSELSKQFGLSKQHISRLFRQWLNTTVTKYINDLKLTHAPELLCHTTLNISEISNYLGFSSSCYFTKLFHQKYYISPTAYIAAYRIESNKDKLKYNYTDAGNNTN